MIGSLPRFARAAWRQAVTVLLVAAALPSAAATTEADVKAAYLYKLPSFVRWPDGMDFGSAFKICVSGRSDVAAALTQLVRGQQVAGRPISVEQLSTSDAARARSCNLLFLGRGSGGVRSLLDAVRAMPVLIVGDRNNGTAGGAVDFVMSDGRVRLAVDRGTASDHHLELSSKLLDVAVKVDP